jgi:hypothetical protein
MNEENRYELEQRLAATNLAVTALALTLVEQRVITKEALIENLDEIGLGVSTAPRSRPANDAIEKLIARIQSAPIPD